MAGVESGCYRQAVDAPDDQGADGLPERHITANQLVAFNMAFFRKAAGLSQQQLGERLGGWSNAAVSAAERSWDGKRIRQFDADAVVAIAAAVGVPVIGMFLPPEDAGTAVHYVLDSPGGAEARPDLTELFMSAIAGNEGTTPVMAAYQRRLTAAGGLYRETRMQQAEQITSDARARAKWLEWDAQERHRQAMGSLVRDREELERRVDDLRAFEREYRSRLGEFMEGMLRDFKASRGPDSDYPAMGSDLPMGMGPRPDAAAPASGTEGSEQ